MNVMSMEALRGNGQNCDATRVISAERGSTGWQLAVRLYDALSVPSGAAIMQKGGNAGGSCFPAEPEAYHLAISDTRAADMPGMPREARAIACAGINCSGAPFLAEQFLNEPVERLLSRAEKRTISRHRILEVYPLVATGRHEAGTLIKALVTFAEAGGRQFILCLTTRGIRLMLRRMGVAFAIMADTGPAPSTDLRVAALRLSGY